MFQKNELRAEMARAGVTVEEMAKAIGMDPSTFYRKQNRAGSFTRDEIGKIIEFLGLDNQAVERIFFAR